MLEAATYGDKYFSDAIFMAEREMQESTLCSRSKLRQTIFGITTIGSVTITAGGSGYGAPTVTFTGGGGRGAAGTVIVSGGVVTGVIITDGGEGYISAPTVAIVGGGGSGATAVAVGSECYKAYILPQFKGTDYYTTGTTHLYTVDCLNVDAIFAVETDGTLTPLYVYDVKTIQLDKDANLQSINLDTSDEIAVHFDGQYIAISAPFDMAGKTLEIWLRFAIPYSADANVATVSGVTIMNSLLEAIPAKFHTRLLSGIKYHIYKMMKERTLDGMYDEQMVMYQQEWVERDLPFVKSKANEVIHFEERITVKAASAFDERNFVIGG